MAECVKWAGFSSLVNELKAIYREGVRREIREILLLGKEYKPQDVILPPIPCVAGDGVSNFERLKRLITERGKRILAAAYILCRS